MFYNPLHVFEEVRKSYKISWYLIFIVSLFMGITQIISPEYIPTPLLITIPCGILIGGAINWFIIRICGGRATYSQATNLCALQNIIYTVATLCLQIPLIGYLVCGLINIYGLIVQIKGVVHVGGTSMLRTVITYIIFYSVTGLLIFIGYCLLVLALFAKV